MNALASTDILDADTLAIVELDQLRTHPSNIRSSIGDIGDLVISVREEGVLEPLLVTPDAVIVCGHRRYAAAREAGLRTVPCLVRDLGAAQQIEAMLAENIQRSDITPLEEAQAYQQLFDLGEGEESVAQRVGLREERIRRRRALLQLPNVARAMLQEGRMTLGAAEQLLKLKHVPMKMAELAEEEAEDATVEQPITHFWDVDRILGQQERELRRAKSREKAEAQGLTVIDDPGYSGKKTRRIGRGYDELNVDLKEHRKLPCHAVYIDEKGRLQPACSKPSTHKGEIATATSAPASHNAGRAEQERRQQALAEARSKRIAMLRDYISDGVPPALDEHVARLLWHTEEPFPDWTLTARLLGFEVKDGFDNNARAKVGEFLAHSGDQQRIFTAAVVLASVENQMDADFGWEQTEGARHIDFCMSLGYELSDVERELYDEHCAPLIEQWTEDPASEFRQ